jgi:hypothetical protein
MAAVTVAAGLAAFGMYVVWYVHHTWRAYYFPGR